MGLGLGLGLGLGFLGQSGMPSIASLKALSNQKAATFEPWSGPETGLE